MELNEIGRRAKAASRHLGILSTSKKNEALRAVAAALVANSADIIAANEIDVKNAKENGMSEALLDRLSVNEARVKAMADGILQVADLKDPVGEVLSKFEDRAILSRLGGDEFLFYMKNVEKDEAADLARQIMKDFEERKEGNTYLSVSSLSIGLCMTTTMDSYSDVVKKADRALYYVKQSGKCGYYFYNQDVSFTQQSNSIDLMKLVSNLTAQRAYNGTLNLEYREFTKVYDYVQNRGKRYGYNIQLVMITLEALGTDSFYVDERERAMTCMEKTIQASLRSVDVSTRYGSEQFVVILLNAGSEYIETITKRIEENFHKIYSKVNIRVSFNVADLAGMKN